MIVGKFSIHHINWLYRKFTIKVEYIIRCFKMTYRVQMAVYYRWVMIAFTQFTVSVHFDFGRLFAFCQVVFAKIIFIMCVLWILIVFGFSDQ